MSGEPSVDQVCGELARLAPLRLAEDWDNVGLLIGDRRNAVRRIMTCLTVTMPVVDEAIEGKVDLIVTHHPIPFKPLVKLTSDNTVGRLLLKLIAGRVAVYSAHTAFDSAAAGINAMWSELLTLAQVRPLVEPSGVAEASGLGAGRYGQLSSTMTLDQLAKQVATAVRLTELQVVGSAEQPITRVAVACGSGGSFLAAAARAGCNCLVTGEANFHTCLEAESLGVGLILVGHFASERFAMERLSGKLSALWPQVEVWPSRAEADPVRTLRL